MTTNERKTTDTELRTILTARIEMVQMRMIEAIKDRAMIFARVGAKLEQNLHQGDTAYIADYTEKISNFQRTIDELNYILTII